MKQRKKVASEECVIKQYNVARTIPRTGVGRLPRHRAPPLERGTWGLETECMQEYMMVVPQKQHLRGDSVVLKVQPIAIPLRCFRYLIPEVDPL